VELSTVFIVFFLALTLFLLYRYLPGFSNAEREKLRTEIDQLRADMMSMAREHEERISGLKEHYESKIDELKRQHISQLATLMAMMHETKTQLSNMQNKTERERNINVLAIWPHSDTDPLNVADEAEGLFNSGVSYDALTGSIERRDVVRRLRRGKYNVLQVDAHGTKQYIYLNDDTPTLPGWWARLVKDHDIDLVVLMACNSDSSMADGLLRNGVNAVITVDGEIKDAAAVDFVTALYENLASGDSLKFAVERAKLVMDFDQQAMIRHWGEDLWKG
jgi:hypothetical protein